MVSRAEGVAEKVRKVGVATEGDRQDLCGDGDTLVLVVIPCYFLPRWYHTETISNSHAGPLYYFFNCMRIYCYLTIQVFTYKQANKKQISKPQRPVATLRGKNTTAKHLISSRCQERWRRVSSWPKWILLQNLCCDSHGGLRNPSLWGKEDQVLWKERGGCSTGRNDRGSLSASEIMSTLDHAFSLWNHHTGYRWI